MELVKHIRDLLYHHDCVIIPGFGGFVTNERSARIDKASDTFNPPAREVGFNARLDHNDGLLISYLSAKLSMNYVDVRKMVDSLIEEVNRKLEEGKDVYFEGIGHFSSDKQKNLLFDPDPGVNFLTDAWGLSFFRFPAIEGSGAGRKPDKKRKDKVSSGLPGKAKRMLRYAAIGIPLVAALGWGAMNTGIVREFNFNLSNLNPFSAVVDSQMKAIPETGEEGTLYDIYFDSVPDGMSNQRQALLYEERTSEIAESVMEPVAEPVLDPVTESVVEPVAEPVLDPVTESVVEPVGETFVDPAVELVTAEAVKPSVKPDAGRKYIIAGSFKNRDNAAKLISKLEADGYRPELITEQRGLYMVSLYSTDIQGEALQMLRQVRTMAGRNDAWILSR